MILHTQKRDALHVPIAQHGSYDVRLCEPPAAPQSDAICFWIELFDHAAAVVVDSHGGANVEEAAAAAERMIYQAIRLHQESSHR
jgi:hypothetical protein